MHSLWRSRRAARGAVLALACCTVSSPGRAQDATRAERADWYPAKVEVFTPPFAETAERSEHDYVPLERAEKPWRLVVYIPHLKDAYWLGVNYGLVAEARRLGVRLSIHEAGGYEHLDLQRKQIEADLGAGEVDGMIVGAISLDGLNDLVERAVAGGIPVVDLINGISSPAISARAAASFRDMGHAAGSYLRELPHDAEAPSRVAWFPGPEGAGWVAAGDAGFREAIAGRPIEIVVSAHGDTGAHVQGALVEHALDEHGDALDYIVGTAVTAETAVAILRERGLSERTRVLSYYYSPGVHRAIARGQVLAAPSDCQVTEARIAVDMLVRTLEGREPIRHVAPRIQVIDRESIRAWDATSSIAPRGFRPTFRVNK